MRTVVAVFLSAFFTIILIAGSYVFFDTYLRTHTLSPLGFITATPTPTIKEKPLEKYSIPSLSKRQFSPGEITFTEPVATTAAYTKYPFHFQSDGKRVTGLATIPNSVSPVILSGAKSDLAKSKDLAPQITSKLPVIIQLRGYVDPTIYYPGLGTSRSAEVFAENGYVSLAPDFLGYADSDQEATDIFESRFETYTTVLQLLSSLSSISFIDQDRVGIWAHSNGGQIALTVLEVLNKPIPTTLWAPVTKYFPYSILYFTDEAPDGGKFLRKELARFEADYDVDDFTLAKHLDRLTGPILLHQGTADDAVPIRWSNEFVDSMDALDEDIVTYYTYPNADHNMSGSWNTVVERDLEFFKKEL